MAFRRVPWDAAATASPTDKPRAWETGGPEGAGEDAVDLADGCGPPAFGWSAARLGIRGERRIVGLAANRAGLLDETYNGEES
jgi:hypothetical protein